MKLFSPVTSGISVFPHTIRCCHQRKGEQETTERGKRKSREGEEGARKGTRRRKNKEVGEEESLEGGRRERGNRKQ